MISAMKGLTYEERLKVWPLYALRFVQLMGDFIESKTFRRLVTVCVEGIPHHGYIGGAI